MSGDDATDPREIARRNARRAASEQRAREDENKRMVAAEEDHYKEELEGLQHTIKEVGGWKNYQALEEKIQQSMYDNPPPPPPDNMDAEETTEVDIFAAGEQS